MTKRIKKSILSLCVLCSSAAMAIGVSISASAEDNYGGYGDLFPAPSTFALIEGASVRDKTPTGIRFEAGISDEDMALLSKNAQFGALITLDRHLQGEALTFQTEKYVDIPTEVWRESSSFGEGYQSYYATLVGGTEGNFTDFVEAHYGEVFVARGYVKSNGVTYYTPNVVQRTIAGVAARAIEEGKGSSYLQTIVSQASKVNLTFDTQGGTAIEKRELVRGYILREEAKPTPTKADYQFGGWYENAACTGEEFTFDGILTEDTTLYAKWEANFTRYGADALSQSGKTLTVNIADGNFTEGNYLTVDFTIDSRTANESDVATDRIFTNANNPANTVLIYDTNDHVVADRQALSGSYRAALKITDSATDKTLTVGENTALTINEVRIYTQESFERERAHSDATTQLPATAYDLVKGGISGYTIVLPDIPEGYEEEAASDLQKYFAQATSITLPIKRESEVDWENGSLLAIGNTAFATDNGVADNVEDLGARGFRIRQLGANVILLGNTSMGTLCAVYEFLTQQFNFEPYALDYIAIDTGVKDEKLLAFALEDIPDVDYTHGYYYEEYRDGALAMRYNYYEDVFLSTTNQPWHNTFEYVPKATYQAEHPKWYTEDGTQLHYSARGDEEELKALQDAVYAYMVAAIEREFAKGNYYEYIGFIHEDNQSFAEDSSVQTFKDTYGDAYEAAMVIQFINPIAERLEQYMTTYQNGREMNIVIGAYLRLTDAPVEKVDGEYQPVDESVYLRSNVSVLLAPIDADYARDFHYVNHIEERTAKWKAITTNGRQPLYWFYDYYTACPLVYFDNTYNLQNIIGIAKNSPFVFNETVQPHETNPFASLKTYLTSKLSWNTEADINALIDGFFHNYFGVAGESMWRLFDGMLTHIAPMIERSAPRISVIPGGDTQYYDSAAIWTKEILDQMQGHLNEAYAAISSLERAEYQALKDRIDRESLTVRYLLLQHHATATYTQTQFNAEKEAFKADCARLGITAWNYGVNNISEWIDSILYD